MQAAPVIGDGLRARTPMPSGREEGGHLIVGREATGRLLREGQRAVHGDLEDAAAALDELDLGVTGRQQLLPHTAGTRFVVSSDAVFDTNIHGPGLSVVVVGERTAVSMDQDWTAAAHRQAAMPCLPRRRSSPGPENSYKSEAY